MDRENRQRQIRQRPNNNRRQRSSRAQCERRPGPMRHKRKLIVRHQTQIDGLENATPTVVLLITLKELRRTQPTIKCYHRDTTTAELTVQSRALATRSMLPEQHPILVRPQAAVVRADSTASRLPLDTVRLRSIAHVRRNVTILEEHLI